MKRPLTFLAFVSTALLLGCSDDGSSARGRGGSERGVPEAQRPTLSFYHIPQCFLCGELSGTLGELERQHGSAMNFRTVDYHLPASQERIHKNQLGSHGVIIADAEGNSLWSMIAHKESKEALTSAVEGITKGTASH